jgi:hypothetical protein
MFMAAAEFLPARLLPDNATDHNREIALTTPAAPPKVIKDYRRALNRSQSRALREGFVNVICTIGVDGRSDALMHAARLNGQSGCCLWGEPRTRMTGDRLSPRAELQGFFSREEIQPTLASVPLFPCSRKTRKKFAKNYLQSRSN